ncbi:MAG TPA: S8 family serine peptidase [Cytophagaceae bacterium]|jgi:subtilisin family serine protease|nr:S8 family serine peptidase [Cytophagaceae bacterium]
MLKSFSLAAALVLSTGFSYSQDKFWIFLKDKDIQNYDYHINLSEQTIRNRTLLNIPLEQYTDIPVNAEYMSALSKQGAKIVNYSKWLNAVSARLTADEFEKIRKNEFVIDIIPIDKRIMTTGTVTDLKPEYFSIALSQMQGQLFGDDKISGTGVQVGVIDAGYYKARTDKYLTHLFNERRIIAQRDFIDISRKDLVDDSFPDSDYHGRIVLDMIIGYDPIDKTQVGMAVNADIYLARTENGAHEYRGEEDNWVRAMEWMDSMGVRLINTSLGYAIKMDDPNENYKQTDMNGKTTIITKAAQIAVDQKGIFLVVSAGNEGDNDEWKIISAPADAQGVLSVGATRDKVWNRIGYSSIGPEFLPYMKPNVSCFSPNGTSFSAPAIAGFVACMMQKNPSLTNKQLFDVIQKSGHLYPYGNNYIGYGVPQASRAKELLSNPAATFNNTLEKRVKGKKVVLKFQCDVNEAAVLFHKKSEIIVVEQSTALVKNGKLKLKRKDGISRTTVAVGSTIVEVFWN